MNPVASLYADLSGYYDRFCADIDYGEQSAFALRAFQCFASSGGRDYLDLACGTGAHLVHMGVLGFQLWGLDNSAAMLAQAATRVPAATLLQSDMAALAHDSSFDLITCFLYSIHYNHPAAALVDTLRQVRRALKPGGVFIFNAVDVAGIGRGRRVVSTAVDGDGALRFESGWHYGGSGDLLELHLSISRESPQGSQRWDDRHPMTALSFATLDALLADSGFEASFLEHDYTTMRPWDGKSHNTIVVATRPAPG